MEQRNSVNTMETGLSRHVVDFTITNPDPSFLVGEGQIGCGFVVQRLELGPRSSDHSIGTVRVVAGSLKTEAL